MRDTARKLLLYGTAQALAFFLGLYIVNSLTIWEFGKYTTYLALSQTLVITADLGITSALSYYYRQENGFGRPFSAYYQAALACRNGLLAIASLVILPIFVSYAQPAEPVVQQIGYLVVALAIAIASVQAGTTATVLRIAGRVDEAQKIDAQATILRWLMLLTLFAGLGAGSALWVMVVSAMAGAVQVYLTNRAFAPHMSHFKEDNLWGQRRQLISYIIPIVPGSLYFAFQSNITIWLSAYLGHAGQVAEVGALGRLGQLFGFLSYVASGLIIPRLIATTDPSQFSRRYLTYGGILIAIVAVLVFVSTHFPSVFLLPLGSQYTTLDKELPLMMLASGLTLVGGYAVQVTRMRGWNRLEWICTSVQICGQIAMLVWLDVSTTRGVYSFAIGSALVYTLPYIIVNIVGLNHPTIVQSRKIGN